MRLTGSEVAVVHGRRVVTSVGGSPLEDLEPAAARAYWHTVASGAVLGPVTLRLGALAESLSPALDLVTHHLDDGWITTGISPATVRWSGSAPAERLRLLRQAAAQQELPLTVERAPWATLAELGHFGAYREGVGRLVTLLRRVFDPGTVLLLPGDG